MNYQKELESLLERLQKSNEVPKLLLHSCCAPCSSYVLEYLSDYFDITIFYYNPNIFPENDYDKCSNFKKNLFQLKIQPAFSAGLGKETWSPV